ncbi:MAG TPA: winged helix-turn-helix domain-containing protein [Xanthobacteraceae bacterium]
MAATGDLEFGPFRLLAGRRELLAHGVPVALGQRAFDVLLALIERPGQLVTKDELMAQVWPGVVVEENNLQAQVSTLRKIFKTAPDGERYLVTVAGRGYRFVAPVQRAGAAGSAANVASAATDAAPAKTDPVRGNLPQPLTGLIGREHDLATVGARLSAHRLVTVTGAGGVGKTRLAIEVGNALMPAFADGVWFAELAALGEPHHVMSGIVEGLGVGAAIASLDELAAVLRDKHLLLIVDNCEHVLAETARIVERLLRHCPRICVLASSREALGLTGESVFRVPSLPTPDPDALLTARAAGEYPAVRLFAERATALGVDFALTDDNAATVGAICRRLDGLPLAIELAAPRLKVMSLPQLARGLDERFRLLTAGPRTALPRHQTLEALIDWSFDLLSAAEQRFLLRFSAFAGGVTIDSIAGVVADREIAADTIIDLLSSLVEKSLVVADLAGREPRYGMLESTRLYARTKLARSGESAIRARHARHFAARLAQASDAWEVTSSPEWGAAYAADVDDVRLALDWAFGPGGDEAAGLELVGRAHLLWGELGLMSEHRHFVEQALARSTAATAPDVVARLLSWQAGDVKDIDDPAEHADAMRAAAIYRNLGDGFAEGRMLLRAGAARLQPDDSAEGERLLRDAQALLAPRGQTKSLARCLSALATARLFAADVTTARELHARAVGIYRDLGEPGS